MQGFGASELSFWQHAVKVLALLSGLVGVLLVGAHFFKKYRGSRPGGQSLIRILESRYLSPKTAVHLVAVGSARFLLGSTGEGVTLLTALPPDWRESREDSVATTPAGPLTS